jgi:hypothetical protein
MAFGSADYALTFPGSRVWNMSDMASFNRRTAAIHRHSFRLGGWIKGFSPELYGAQRGDAPVVFALP